MSVCFQDECGGPDVRRGVTQEVGGGRLGVKKCGRWEIGKQCGRWEIGVYNVGYVI